MSEPDDFDIPDYETELTKKLDLVLAQLVASANKPDVEIVSLKEYNRRLQKLENKQPGICDHEWQRRRDGRSCIKCGICEFG